MTDTVTQDAQAIIGVSITMMVLVAIALVLRIFARLGIQQTFGPEDWFIWTAAALFVAYNGVLLGFVARSEAEDSLVFLGPSASQFDFTAPYIFALGLLFVYGIAAVKTSLLIFYTRIFPTRGISVNCMLWGLGSAAWQFELQLLSTTTCISSLHIIFGSELSNMMIDIAILTLPVFVINRLQLKQAKKTSVSFIFLLGGFICICCAVRIYWVYVPGSLQPRGSTQALHNWTTIELASAIICACLPTYAPLFTRKRVILARVKTWYAQRRTEETHSIDTLPLKRHDVTRRPDDV